MIFAMGSECIKMLAAIGAVPKGRSINSLRGQLFALPSGAHCMVSYTADIQEIDYGLFVDLQCDIGMAVRVAKTGELHPSVGDYSYVKHFEAEQEYVRVRNFESGQSLPVTMDLETWGLDPYNPERHIVSVQITVKSGTAAVVTFDSVEAMCTFNGDPALGEQIKWFLTTPRIRLRGANFKYDLGWIAEKWGFLCKNFTFDTTIVGSLLDENRSNRLNVHSKVYTPMGGYDDEFERLYDKGQMPTNLTKAPEQFLTYAGGDTDACLQVSEAMTQELMEQPDLCNFYNNLLHPAARTYEAVERVGWCVDLPYYEHLKDELEFELARLTAIGKELLGGRLVARHTNQKKGTLNLQKAALLKDFMFSPDGLNLKPLMVTDVTKEPSTAMEHLEQFADHPIAKPFIAMLNEYGSAKKTYDTYCVGFLQHLRADGRFHPNFIFYKGSRFDRDDETGGTTTGRLAATDPAVQTIPHYTIWAKKIRTALIAPEGYLILANDVRQGELKVMACLSHEEAMIAAYTAGIDLHALTGSFLNGYTWEQFQALQNSDPELAKLIRQGGKAGNFGLIYGMRPNGFMNYAWSQYQVRLTLDESTDFGSKFFAKYPRLPQYHEEQIAYAQQYGCVVSPLGRVRHLPLIKAPTWKVRAKDERRAINAPTQSTLSDMLLLGQSEMQRLGMLRKDPAFGMIHDQSLRYVREDHWERVAKESKEIMESLPLHKFGWKPALPFPVDCEIGSNLGNMKMVPM